MSQNAKFRATRICLRDWLLIRQTKAGIRTIRRRRCRRNRQRIERAAEERLVGDVEAVADTRVVKIARDDVLIEQVDRRSPRR